MISIFALLFAVHATNPLDVAGDYQYLAGLRRMDATDLGDKCASEDLSRRSMIICRAFKEAKTVVEKTGETAKKLMRKAKKIVKRKCEEGGCTKRRARFLLKKILARLEAKDRRRSEDTQDDGKQSWRRHINSFYNEIESLADVMAYGCQFQEWVKNYGETGEQLCKEADALNDMKEWAESCKKGGQRSKACKKMNRKLESWKTGPMSEYYGGFRKLIKKLDKQRRKNRQQE